MTPLEKWRHLARAENERAQRNWQGLENDLPVKIRRLKPKAKPRISALKQQGLPPQEIADLLGVSKVLVNMDIREIKDEQARGKARQRYDQH